MRKTTNLYAPPFGLVSARRLRAAFPLAAAAKPVARCRNTRGVTVENCSDRQRQSPGRRQVVKPHRHEKGRSHESNGSVHEEPGFARISEKKNPGQQKGCKQSGQRGDQ